MYLFIYEYIIYTSIHVNHRASWFNGDSLDFSSNLGRGIYYPVWGFSWFFSIPSRKYQDSVLLAHDRFLSNNF
jgi:hypothetical protein